MTEARTTLYETLDELETVLGGEWDNQDDPTPRGCTIPIWVDGELYPGLRIGEAPADVGKAIAALERFWGGMGLTPVATTVGSATEVQTRDAVGGLLVVRVSEEAMTIGGESECRPKR